MQFYDKEDKHRYKTASKQIKLNLKKINIKDLEKLRDDDFDDYNKQ